MQDIHALVERAKAMTTAKNMEFGGSCPHDHIIYDWDNEKYECVNCGHTYDYNPN